jgi:hypothetical protein
LKEGKNMDYQDRFNQAAEIDRLQECYRNASAEEERLRSEIDRLKEDGLCCQIAGEIERDRLRALVARQREWVAGHGHWRGCGTYQGDACGCGLVAIRDDPDGQAAEQWMAERLAEARAEGECADRRVVGDPDPLFYDYESGEMRR